MHGDWRGFENKQFEKAVASSACYAKKVSMLAWCATVLTLVVLSLTPHAMAQESRGAAPVGEVTADSGESIQPLPERSYKEPTKNLITLALGGAIWPSLGNKEFGTTSATANSPGHVSSTGFAFETAYHRHIAHWERGALYLGGEFGAFIFDNEGSGDTTQPSTSPITGALDARVWYAGPSIKFMMGQGRFKYFLGAGGGYYQLHLSESDEIPRPPCTNFGPCFQTNRSLNKSAIGGYVSLGVDLVAFRTESEWEWRVRLEDKVHLVNFGSLDSFAPGVGNLSGPINVIQIGVVAGF
jgi:hypothetical protein